MTDDQFDALVRKLEVEARADPSGYRRRVRRMLWLGYAVPVASGSLFLAAALVLVYAVAVGGAAAWLWLPALALLVGLGTTVVASFRLRIPPPAGVGLDRARHPRAFAMVDAMAEQLGADRVHYILVSDEFNAAMAHLPRFGLFGGYRNYLVLGLPLMYALSPRQLAAVVGHELGHLSERDGRLSAAAYRTNRVCQRWLLATAGRGGLGAAIAFRFFRWYAPRYAATTFVMRQAAEYQADQAAAQVTSPADAADALARVAVADRYHGDRASTALTDFCKLHKEPPEGIYDVLLESLGRPGESPHVRRWLRAALAADTERGDTHPSLSERLAALGRLAHVESHLSAAGPAAGLFPPLKRSAAADLLGDDLPRLTGLLEQGWLTSLAPAWRRRRQMIREARAALRALDNQAEHVRLSEAEAWRRALLVAEMRDPKEAVPDAWDTARRNPKDAEINLAAGRILLEAGDARGVQLVEAAMAESLAAVEPGCEAVAAYLTAAGRAAEADAYARRAERHYYAVRSGVKERQSMTGADAYQAHDLTGDKIDYLRVRLAEVPEVAAAYLVQKVMVNFAERHKLYLLGIVPAGKLSAKARERVLDTIIEKTRSFEHRTSLVMLDDKEADLRAAVTAVPGGRIFWRAAVGRSSAFG